MIPDLSKLCLTFLSLKQRILFGIYQGERIWPVDGLCYAAEGGHRHLVNVFINQCTNWKLAMAYAATGGHKHLIDFFIAKGANYWNMAMAYAARGGHKDLVDLFITKGASNFAEATDYAYEGGHIELAEFLNSKFIKP